METRPYPLSGEVRAAGSAALVPAPAPGSATQSATAIYEAACVLKRRIQAALVNSRKAPR
jgi:hypothetical protein